MSAGDSQGEAPQAGATDRAAALRDLYDRVIASLTVDQAWAVEIYLRARVMAAFTTATTEQRLQNLLEAEAAKTAISG